MCNGSRRQFTHCSSARTRRIWSSRGSCTSIQLLTPATNWVEALHQPPTGLTHADRIKWMCSKLRVVTPAWADEVAAIRNDALHEALFMDAPLGFEAHTGSNQNLTLVR